MMDCKFIDCWRECMEKEQDEIYCDEHCAICEEDEEEW